ncbi:MAG: hypothetical protein FJ147_17380 [Deltaproteobacteria bacterium]|nr:hypothetical protein [Deltaproteobacteria bacterium]
MNTASSRQHGITDEELQALSSFETGPFSEREKAALRLASTLAHTSQKPVVDEALMKQLQDFFSDGEIVELSMVIAVLIGMAKMLFAFDWVEREDYCPFPQPQRPSMVQNRK